ncbi:MAG: hypothetical protein ACJA00_004441 [Myxococcota bacterium]|jgi:hypothetical protein
MSLPSPTVTSFATLTERATNTSEPIATSSTTVAARPTIDRIPGVLQAPRLDRAALYCPPWVAERSTVAVGWARASPAPTGPPGEVSSCSGSATLAQMSRSSEIPSASRS